MGQGKAFVIMPYAEPLTRIFKESIEPVIDAADLECSRADDLKYGSALKNIVDGICNATVVVADLTGKNANVFYELGIAHTLGVKVIMLTQSNVEDIPFNIKTEHVISYNDFMGGDRALKRDLAQTLSALLTDPEPASNPVQVYLPKPSRAITRGEYTRSLEAAVRLSKQLAAQENDIIALKDQVTSLKARIIALNDEATVLKGENGALREQSQQLQLSLNDARTQSMSPPSPPASGDGGVALVFEPLPDDAEPTFAFYDID